MQPLAITAEGAFQRRLEEWPSEGLQMAASARHSQWVRAKIRRALPTQNPLAFPAVPLTVVGLAAFDSKDPVELLQQDHEGKFVLEGQGA